MSQDYWHILTYKRIILCFFYLAVIFLISWICYYDRKEKKENAEASNAPGESQEPRDEIGVPLEDDSDILGCAMMRERKWKSLDHGERRNSSFGQDRGKEGVELDEFEPTEGHNIV